MDNRQYNFFVYQFLCFLMAMYVISLSSVVWHVSAKQSDTYLKGISVHTVDHGGMLPDGYFDSHYDQPGNPVDAPEPTEPEQDCDFTTLFVFAPIQPAVKHLIAGNMTYRPQYNPTHVAEINAPPPQLYA